MTDLIREFTLRQPVDGLARRAVRASVRSLRATAIVATLLASAGGAAAQSGISFKLHCHNVGQNAPEPIGDREGHAISAGDYSCRVEGGPLDGGVLTGQQMLEWQGTQATLLTGAGVIRKPGATTAIQHTEGTQALVLTDGNVTGSTGRGKGRTTMASGAASPLAGKTYSYSFAATRPGQFVVDVRYD